MDVEVHVDEGEEEADRMGYIWPWMLVRYSPIEFVVDPFRSRFFFFFLDFWIFGLFDFSLFLFLFSFFHFLFLGMLGSGTLSRGRY